MHTCDSRVHASFLKLKLHTSPAVFSVPPNTSMASPTTTAECRYRGAGFLPLGEMDVQVCLSGSYMYSSSMSAPVIIHIRDIQHAEMSQCVATGVDTGAVLCLAIVIIAVKGCRGEDAMKMQTRQQMALRYLLPCLPCFCLALSY